MTNKTLTLAVQKSGRLADAGLEFLRRAGLRFVSANRALKAPCRNFPLELIFLRSKDIPRAVAQGVADLGICGEDALLEQASDELTTLERLGFGRCRLCLAAPGPLEIEGKKIATSFPNILRGYLNRVGKTATVVELSGSVEIAPSLQMADAICDLVSTGSTLTQNGLVELETVLESQAVLVAKNGLTERDCPVLGELLLRVRSTLAAKQNKYIVMNAPEDAVEDIKQLLPGLKNPTISALANPGWVSLATVVRTEKFWETIKALKAAGAEGILVLPIEQIVE